MDFVTSLIVRFFVFISVFAKRFYKSRFSNYDEWEIGKKLKILLIGFNGERNTGTDVQSAIIARTLDKLFGEENIEISVMTFDKNNSKGYFEGNIRFVEFSNNFFVDLFKACCSHHMAVLSEGSILKSKFSNSKTLFFSQAAGIMKRQDKPCIAFGAEAGEMDEFIIKLVRKMFDKTYFIAKTKESLRIINVLGMEGHLGTHMAWSVKSLAVHKEKIKKDILKSGWDGKKPLVGISVTNPFCWPLKPSFLKYLKSIFTRNWSGHHEKYYFFSWSKEREKNYNKYLSNIAFAINKYSEVLDFHTVIIGMDALDQSTCKKLQTYLKKPGIIFSSKYYDGYELKEVLNSLSFLITSNYDARVMSMDEKIPAIAISLDDSLRNIFNETGQLEKFYFDAYEEDLGNKLYRAIRSIKVIDDFIYRELDKSMDYYQKKMEQMGLFLYEFTRSSFNGIILKESTYGKYGKKEAKGSGKVS